MNKSIKTLPEKKLLQINSVVNRGSTGKIVEETGRLADALGWNSRVAFGRESNDSRLINYRIGGKADVIEHYAISRLLDKHGRGSKRATEKLVEWIIQNEIDIIHLHNIHGYYLHYPTLFGFLKESLIPVVWTLHDCWAFTGHCSYFSDIQCDKWKSKCHHCPKTKNYPASLFLDNSKNNFQLKKEYFNGLKNLEIVTVSDWLGGLVKESFLGDYPVRTIHNGVNMNVFKPYEDHSAVDEKYKLKGKWVAVAAATAWSAHKGLEDYKKLSTLLAEDEFLILVGLSEKQIEQLPSQIIGIPRTENQEELAALYSRANVVLNLSSQETFGMTTAEGFACGTPGIVYNATASPELIRDSNTGFILELGDIQGVYNAMKALKAQPKEPFIKNCRKTAEENYNQVVQFHKYVALYDSMLKQ